MERKVEGDLKSATVAKPAPHVDASHAWMMWKPEDVGRWLTETLNLPLYAQAFEQNDVDGPMLLELSEDLLEDCLYVKNPIHRKKILAHAKLLPMLAGLREAVQTGGPGIPNSWGQDKDDAVPTAASVESLCQLVQSGLPVSRFSSAATTRERDLAVPDAVKGEETLPCMTADGEDDGASNASAPASSRAPASSVAPASSRALSARPRSKSQGRQPRWSLSSTTLDPSADSAVMHGGGAMAARAALRTSMGNLHSPRSTLECAPKDLGPSRGEAPPGTGYHGGIPGVTGYAPRGMQSPRVPTRHGQRVATSVGPQWGELTPSISARGSFPKPSKGGKLRDTSGGNMSMALNPGWRQVDPTPAPFIYKPTTQSWTEGRGCPTRMKKDPAVVFSKAKRELWGGMKIPEYMTSPRSPRKSMPNPSHSGAAPAAAARSPRPSLPVGVGASGGIGAGAFEAQGI